MIEITNIRQGAILNHNHGTESETSLTVQVEGLSSGRPVKVNGEPAQMTGRKFVKEVVLDQKLNKITVSERTAYGLYSQEIDVLWDKNRSNVLNLTSTTIFFFLQILPVSVPNMPSTIFI